MFPELFRIDFNVAKNLPQQSRADVFPGVDGHGRAAAIGMFELPVASLGLAEKLEAHLFQGANKFAGLDVRQVGGAHTLTST